MTKPSIYTIGIMSSTGMRSGKDTSALILSHQIYQLLNTITNKKYYIDIVRFGDAVKVACSYLFKLPIQDTMNDKNRITIWNDVIRHKRATIRRLLQIFGTDIVRNNISNNFWIDYLHTIISEFANAHCDCYDYFIFLVPDVRFSNEASYVKTLVDVIRYNKHNNMDLFEPRISSIILKEKINAANTIINNCELINKKCIVNALEQILFNDINTIHHNKLVLVIEKYFGKNFWAKWIDLHYNNALAVNNSHFFCQVSKNHISERDAIEKCLPDFIIYNNSDIPSLIQSCQIIADAIVEKFFIS